MQSLKIPSPAGPVDRCSNCHGEFSLMIFITYGTKMPDIPSSQTQTILIAMLSTAAFAMI